MENKVGHIILTASHADGVVAVMETEFSRRKDSCVLLERRDEIDERESGSMGFGVSITKLWQKFYFRLLQAWLSEPLFGNLPQKRYTKCCHIQTPSFRALHKVVLAIYLLASISNPSLAVFINYDNCLGDNVINSKPLQLQFIPYFVNVVFNSTAPSHNLNITIYGNVSGIATQQPYPAPDDPQWNNPNDTVGKITDLSPTNNKYSTLFTTFDVLDYSTYKAPLSRFCNSTVHDDCPLGPVFYANG